MTDTDERCTREDSYEHERRIVETRRYIAERDGRISRPQWIANLAERLALPSGRVAVA